MLEVSVNNVGFAYDEEAILTDINMEVESGTFVCLLGQSGCGKSTFLRLLAGLEKPNHGEIYVKGSLLTKPSLDRSMVFQDSGLFPWMTAGENIIIALKQKFPKMSNEERRKEAIRRLRDVGLDETSFNKLPKELSGGMQQRCAIARAFSINPPILLMDEPFGALDAVTRSNLQSLVIKLWDQEKENKKTVFFVTHDVDEALILATDIFIFGQAPSNIIHSCSIKKHKTWDMNTIHSDQNAIKLRNDLVKIIHTEIERKNKNNIK